MNFQQEKVCIVADNVVNALGFSTEEAAIAMQQLYSGCKLTLDYFNQSTPSVLATINKEQFTEKSASVCAVNQYTFFEQLMIFSIDSCLKNASIDPTRKDVLFLFSSTKGNIELLENPQHFESNRIYLWKSAECVAQHFGNPNKSIVVSNACVSGTQALSIAKHLLNAKQYKHIVVCGADCISKFVVSGFQSFKAFSSEICKPFDAKRTGLNLGEGAATVILSLTENSSDYIEVFSEGGANDANHISGPSRTGEGLYRAIEKAVSGIDKKQFAFINAHGTATLYNDEMEAIAFSKSGMENVPINSYKAYFGHTLGAAGVMETVLSAFALKHDFVFTSKGFENLGVSIPLNINTKLSPSNGIYCLKTASGFGGCNAALVLKKGGVS